MRRVLEVLVIAFSILLAGPMACSRKPAAAEVVVLGFDGMDYDLTRKLMAEGRMPNFSRLARTGSFAPLASSTPPQSPVAWSTFITGADPGIHGIYDFIHRDPQTMAPYLSTTRTTPPSRNVRWGKWQFPLEAGRVELLRQGEPFWEALRRHGTETTIVRMPANFPPSGSATRELTGMGTPDILGTYGTFSFYTSDPSAFSPAPSGGRVVAVNVEDHIVRAAIEGPDNPFLRDPQTMSVRFTVFVDPEAPVAKLAVGDEERILEVGEWSDWLKVEFPVAPFQKVRGMCRFYLKQVRPRFELYASPINIDPFAPALPISTPSGYAAALARSTGRYYTQGMPDDTKALSAKILSRDEFLQQARIAREENRRQLGAVMERFSGGFLFYYFGDVDQVSHMMWRAMDPEHPAYDPIADPPYRHVIEDLYAEFDGIVGEATARLSDRAMLVVMSDHGFSSWRRVFNLNAWLEQNGLLTVIDRGRRETDLFANIDFSRTRAYGFGLNGLYINTQGREAHGIVPASERDALAREIAAKLAQAIDPATGRPGVRRVFRREEVYATVGHPEITPDLIVGYAKGTRVSNESALGAVPPNVFADNTGEWSGDHCMDPDAVPGVLLTSRRLKKPARSLQDLAAALLAEFGVEPVPSNDLARRAAAR